MAMRSSIESGMRELLVYVCDIRIVALSLCRYECQWSSLAGPAGVWYLRV